MDFDLFESYDKASNWLRLVEEESRYRTQLYHETALTSSECLTQYEMNEKMNLDPEPDYCTVVYRGKKIEGTEIQLEIIGTNPEWIEWAKRKGKI